MSDAVIIENLSVKFGAHEALRNVSARFPRSGISVLVGRSGSGKTTLLRSVNRLNEEFPHCVTSGRVLINFSGGASDIYMPGALSMRELRTRVGMLFQTPNLFPVSVYRNLALPLELVCGHNKNELEDRIRAALEAVGLWRELSNRLNTQAERLSGGQQQRLCLARTLAMEPEVLLLDEPTASLDVHASGVIEDLLLNLAEQYTMIMVSHSLGQAKRMGRRIFVLEDGSIGECLDATDSISEELLAKLL